MDSAMKARILDALERAGWSAGQTLVVVLLTTGALTDMRNLSWGFALGTAGGAFVFSALATLLLYVSKLAPGCFWADLGLRLAKTFVAALLGAIEADYFDAFTFDWKAALNIAVLATLGALGKGLLARQETAYGNNPSTLPPATCSLVTQY
jgi:hypothetical protein